MLNEIKQDVRTRMQKSVENLAAEMAKIRTGRANISLLDSIVVEYYGNPAPLNQVAAVNVQDSRTLLITPFDKSMIASIDKAIRISGLGLNPVTAGIVIRVPLPPLTEERRKDLVKIIKAEGEKTKISVRNIRRDANTQAKVLLKDKEISEDDDKKLQNDVQKVTDEFIAIVEDKINSKEQELLHI